MNTISFIPHSKEIYDFVVPPKPTNLYIPKWYKETKKYLPTDHPLISLKDKQTIKGCIPVFDSMNIGYIQESWCDMYVEDIYGEKLVKSSCSIPICGERTKEMAVNLVPPSSFNSKLFNFTRPWLPKTPKGYSVVYVHPFWHTDLPFQVMPGVVDSDVFNAAGAASPAFFIQESFSGLIPKGTPLYQILIIKNESWKSSNKKYEEYEHLIKSHEFLIQSKFKNRYKELFWKKKDYK